MRLNLSSSLNFGQNQHFNRFSMFTINVFVINGDSLKGEIIGNQLIIKEVPHHQCLQKLGRPYRTFGQTKSESLSDRSIFYLTEPFLAQFKPKNSPDHRSCVAIY